MFHNEFYLVNEFLRYYYNHDRSLILKSSVISILTALPYGARNYLFTKAFLSQSESNTVIECVTMKIAIGIGVAGFFRSVLSQLVAIYKYVRCDNDLYLKFDGVNIFSYEGIEHIVGSVIYFFVVLAGFYTSCLVAAEDAGIDINSQAFASLVFCLSFISTVTEYLFQVAGNNRILIDTNLVYITQPVLTEASDSDSESEEDSYSHESDDELIEEQNDANVL